MFYSTFLFTIRKFFYLFDYFFPFPFFPVGLLCNVGLYVMANSPIYFPIISNLTSTGLYSFPVYTPTIDPTISGVTIQFLKWVLIIGGFSPGCKFFFEFLNLVKSFWYLPLKPFDLFNFLLILLLNKSYNESV